MKQNRTAKIIQISEKQYLNHETGQIVQEERERVLRLPQEPEFIKLYLQDLGHILDVPAGAQSLLMALVRKIDWDGMISLTPAARERIAGQLGIKVHSLANYLTILCEREILKRAGRGEYEVNPHFLAKGDWTEIQKRRTGFRMTVVYNADGTKKITGSLEPQGELILVPAVSS